MVAVGPAQSVVSRGAALVLAGAGQVVELHPALSTYGMTDSVYRQRRQVRQDQTKTVGSPYTNVFSHWFNFFYHTSIHT